MKSIQKFLALGLMAALAGTAVPAMAQDGYRAYGGGGARSGYTSGRDDHARDDRARDDHARDDRRDGNLRDGRSYRGHDGDRAYRGNEYEYAPARVYAPEPVYAAPTYEDGYYEHRTHYGRTAAIIGGTAAAGAVIGGVSGHGQGAVIGAVIGGVAGLVASAAVDHHHY